MKKCSRCQRGSEEFDKMTMLESNCSHLTCSRCFYKEVVFNYDKITNSKNKKEEMKIKCLICNKGNYFLNNVNINKMLNEGRNCKEKSIECGGDCLSNTNNSVTIAKFFCKSCHKYLCASCLTNSHSEHDFTNNFSTSSNNYCSIHDENLKIQCITCSTIICYLCREKNHKDHEINSIKEVFIEKMEKFKSDKYLPSYEKFCKKLDEEKEEIFEKLKLEIDDRIDNFEKLISKIQDIIFSFKDEINQIKENIELSIQNLKISFESFYNDLEKIKSNDYFNAFLICKLSNLKFDFNFKKMTYDSFNNSYSSMYNKFKNIEKEILPYKIGFHSGYIPRLDNNDVTNFKKTCSYQINDNIQGVLELDDDKFAVWTSKSLELIRYTNSKSDQFESILSYTYDADIIYNFDPFPNHIRQINHIVFKGSKNTILICDKNFSLIQTINEEGEISFICEISSSCSFAVGFADGRVQIYTRNEKTYYYEIKREFKDESKSVSLLYMQNLEFLLCGSHDSKINVYDLSKEGKSTMRLTNCNYSNYLLTCLVYLTEDKFASSHTINSNSGKIDQRPQLFSSSTFASKNENSLNVSYRGLFESSNYDSYNIGLFGRPSNYNSNNNVSLFGRPSNENLNNNPLFGRPSNENLKNNSNPFLPKTENPNNIINIWYLNKSSNSDQSFQCIKTIYPQDNYNQIYLNILSNDFLVCKPTNTMNFTILDLKTHEFIKTYEEDSNISNYGKIIITNNNYFIYSTTDNKINLWKLQY